MTEGSNPSQQQRERARSAASELREYARGELPTDHRDISPAAVLVDDPDLRNLLVHQERIYNKRKRPQEPDFWSLPTVREKLTPEATAVVSEAVEHGKLSVMEYVTGMPEWSNDVSGLHTIRKLENWLIHSEQCKLIYLAGLMGRGKTDWSLMMLQIVAWHYQRIREIAERASEVPEPEFAANFAVETPEGEPDVLHIDNLDDLLKWGEKGSAADSRWFIFDEASTELTAQSGSNAQDVAELFAPFVKKMRKMGINMIVIGHDKGDVHVAIRSMADFVAKDGLKSASLYAGIKNREPAGHIMDLDQIPETTWEYDTNDTAEWSWGEQGDRGEIDRGLSDAERKRLIAIRAAEIYKHDETDMTYEELADTMSTENIKINASMISRAKNGKYDENQILS